MPSFKMSRYARYENTRSRFFPVSSVKMFSAVNSPMDLMIVGCESPSFSGAYPMLKTGRPCENCSSFPIAMRADPVQQLIVGGPMHFQVQTQVQHRLP